MSVTYFLILSCIGFAVTVQAQGCSKPIAGPNMDLKDSDILSDTFENGAQVSFACNPGYMSVGGSAVITCNAGTWSPVRLKCEKKNCGSVGEVANGQIDYPTGTEFGSEAVITCNTGHRLVGTSKILCDVQGWNGRLPECEVVTCDPPPMVAQGTFSPEKDSYEYRDVVQYSCQKDYTLSGSKTISCSEDGAFVPDAPKCIKVQCDDPVIENANWVEGSRPPHGYKATVTYQCRSGYFMTEPGTLTCEINSQWSPGLPQCKAVSEIDCGSAGKVENGRIDYPTGTKFGSEAKISCNTGYSLVGASIIHCRENGWDGRLPVCEVVTCDPPPMVEGGNFSPNKETYKFNEVVEYSCQKDYVLNGSKSLSCLDNGRFMPDPPKCIKVHCHDPVIDNANLVESSRPPYGYKATVTYQCRSGYVMTGPGTLTCEMNSQWSPALPVCKQKGQCPDPVVKHADRVDDSKPPYGYKATVRYQCSHGYVMEGSSTVTCEMNNQWSPLPVCNRSPVVVITVAVIVVMIFIIACGILVYIIKKKQRSRRNYPGKVDTKEGEAVALS